MYNHQLDTFIVVADSGSFNKAAEALLKTLPVDWDYSMPFGLLHAPKPSKTVKRFLNAVKKLNK